MKGQLSVCTQKMLNTKRTVFVAVLLGLIAASQGKIIHLLFTVKQLLFVLIEQTENSLLLLEAAESL